MPTFEKRSKHWRVRVRLKGVEATATFPTKAEAAEWAAEQERKIRQGHRQIDHRRTLGDLLERYAAVVSPQKRGCQWEQTRIRWLLGQPLAKLRLTDLSQTEIASWRDGRLATVTGETVRRDMTLLSHALNVAVKEWGWLHASPMTNVKRPRGNPGRERIATDEEIERLCYVAGWTPRQPGVTDLRHNAKTVSAAVCAAFVFAVETGCRGAEIAAIRPDDVVGGTLRIVRSKNGSGRFVPLSQTARAILEEFGGSFGFTVRQKDAIFRKLRAKAGIEGLNFHDSRRVAITKLSKKLDPLALARMVGHKDLSMLLRYYAPSAEDIAKRLDEGDK